MTTAITTTTVSTTATTTTAASTTAPASTGVSSVASSIASSAPAASQGFSAQISAWIASVADAIRGCLATLPLIGGWFEKNTPAITTTTASTTTPLTTRWTDAELVNMIRGQFVVAPATTTIAVPAADIVNYTLNLFGQIQSPVSKMEAFQAVLGAVNSTDDIARQFYGALSDGTLGGPLEASKTAFREQIWIANGRADDGHGAGYGDHMIAHAIRGPLAQQAAQNLRNLLAATSTTGP